MLQQMEMSYRVKSEGIAIFFKSVLLYLFLRCDLKLLSFALAQLVYCLILLGMYRHLFSQGGNGSSLLYTVQAFMDKEGRSVAVLKEHKDDLREFSLVAVVKFVLTEGEKFIIFALRDFVRYHICSR
jgi:hypothetical protein